MVDGIRPTLAGILEVSAVVAAVAFAFELVAAAVVVGASEELLA